MMKVVVAKCEEIWYCQLPLTSGVHRANMISITEFLSNSLSILGIYAPRMNDYIDFTGSNKAILLSRKEMTPRQHMR